MKQKIFLLLSLILLMFITATDVFGQSNYGSVKVDELSDIQIRQLIQRAEASGYNDAQLEQMAAAQGMKAEEVSKLKMRVEKIRKQGNSLTSTKQSAAVSGNNSNRTDRQYIGDSSDSTASSQPTKQELIDKAFEELKPKIFGSELFKNSNITFEPNLRMATPAGYVIGPDDQLLIDITGDNEANYDLKVSPDGSIRIEYVGLVKVGGLSIEEARSKIKSLMSSTYPGLRSGRTNLAINLGNIRGIKVILNGQVTKPGTYTLSSLSSVFNALYAAGGPNDNGSYRKIQVVRNNKVVATVDFYDLIINGMQKGNIRLQDQDVINVPVYENRVEVVGEVKNPAIFETVAGEHFQNVLNFAGGFSNIAYQSAVKVFQNTARERKISDIFAADFNTYVPRNGDKFFVEPILDRFENRVEISGAVFRPGYFELEKGMTLKQLIQKADGLKEDAFMSRGYISRLNPDNTAGLEAFDVAAIMNGSQPDIPLKREDRITISSIFDLREEYKITVQGEVREPNQFPYAENMSLEDAIQMAGGFKEGASPSRIEISRRVRNSDVLSKSASTADVYTVNIDKNLKLLSDTTFRLQPFDIISVRNAEGYVVQKQVKIEGEVLYPGTYTIKSKDERISDLVKRAGGLTVLAYSDGASLKRPGKDTTLFQSQKDSLQRELVIKRAKYGSTYSMQDLIRDSKSDERREENQARIMNLQRSTQSGVDTTSFSKQAQIIASDMVGIDLTKILKEPGKRNDLLLEDGDIIRVPKQLQTVRVSGEVLNPNNIVFKSGKSFKNYVNGAGGFTASALKGRAYVKYANGSVEGARSFLFFNNYPRIKPGAEILVPKRAEREKITAAAWIGIGTGLASLGAIIVSLLR
ncbi:SLBB domain-containing protein [Pedobacter sp. Leaf194]|uniref:SLBB domain-containing protein n=1 Tax=Pedobacter sp. Leaf194 TaxID=1736297 RepID=UPI00070334A6|nr:SLBB domain-containing protein [Pedobacter sp. Leaf194]KQS37787.1 capsule biosynthesis protein [Pedobacter sp. Leaf194]